MYCGLIGICRVQLAQPIAQLPQEPGFGARVSRRLHGFVVPLHQAVRVGEAALFLAHQRGGQKEHFRPDLPRVKLTVLDLGRGIPECSRLVFEGVADDQPVQVRQTASYEPSVMSAHGRILAHQKQTVDLTVMDGLQHRLL